MLAVSMGGPVETRNSATDKTPRLASNCPLRGRSCQITSFGKAFVRQAHDLVGQAFRERKSKAEKWNCTSFWAELQKISS